MKLEFLPAPADQAETAAPLIYSSGAEMFDYMFDRGGRTALGFLQMAYADGAGFFGHRNHTAAIEAQKIQGIGAFYSGHEYSRLSLGTTWQVMRYYPLKEHFGMLRDFMHVGRWMVAPPKRMDYGANLGVAESARGKGVGSALIEHQKQVAIKKGRSIYALDVADNNPRAQALYERLGFQLKSEVSFTGPDRGIAIPNARRLVMDLPR